MANNTQEPKNFFCLQEQEQQERREEDWCFKCKEGGDLVICDHRNCAKAYHPDCVGKDDSFFANAKAKYWVCDRHHCFKCYKPPKFYCLGCPIAVCKRCLDGSEFTVVKGVKGLCDDCSELVEMIEQNLEHDSEGNKITFDDRETCECLFKEYWEIIKVEEGLTGDDVTAAQHNYKKGNRLMEHESFSEGEEENQNDSMSPDSDEDFKPAKRKRSNSEKFKRWSFSKGEEDRQNGCMSLDSDEDCNPSKSKKSNPEEFMGWGSKPLINFLVSIGKYEREPLTQWSVKSLIYEYIKVKNLLHPKDKRKFLPDEKLFPIFRKKVVPKTEIYALLEFHFAKKLDGSSGETSDDQVKKGSTGKHPNDPTESMESKLSRLIGKPLLKKGDLFTKPSRFASINATNLNLIYLKQSLLVELSEHTESFTGKVVGTFVRAKVDSNNARQGKSHHLVRVLGVVCDEKSNAVLLQVSLMSEAIPISKLSDEDFKEQDCEDLRQKVEIGLLPKLTVVELKEKAKSLHEDITKHRIRKRLVQLQNQIDRANLSGRNRQYPFYERERLERSLEQEQVLKCEPSICIEYIEARYDDTEETDTQDQ
ncbi:hypothetical protein RJT34_20671 [Clitoria ternatea]|uniref:Uncharacterized protein n=1 Tax=Clitoria ternatea TaxID=43366 RepID=A0AAN9ITK0_CLITE